MSYFQLYLNKAELGENKGCTDGANLANSLYFVPSVLVPLCRPLALTLFCQLVNDLKERKKGETDTVAAYVCLCV